MARAKGKADPATVTREEFIASLLPATPAAPALGEPCVIVSSPFTPKGEDTRQWPPVAYHAGASYGPELYVNWALCNVVEYIDRNGAAKQGPRAYNSAFSGQYFLMLDDIGDEKKSLLALSDPRVVKASYLLETSAGNYQVGYVLREPLDATQSAQLRAALVAAKLGDAGSLKSAHRWCRVPGSVNMKPGRDGFKSVLREWHPGRTFTLVQLVKLLGITLDEKVSAPGVSKFDMPADIEEYNDRHFRWMRTIPRGEPGSIIESRRSTGFFPIVCPWGDEHTHGKDGAGYKPGLGDAPPAFVCAHEHGDDPPRTKQFIDWCIEQQGGKVPEKPAAVSKVVPPVSAPTDVFWNFEAVLNAPYPDWLIEEMFARRQVGAIYGEPYAGKSVLAFAITMALAGGASVLGDLDQWEGDVGAVYYALEGNLRTRTEPYRCEGLLMRVPRIRFERALKLDATADDAGLVDLHEKVAQAKELDPRLALVVVDTLARASLVDENSADLGSIAELMRIIAEEYDVCVMIVHHSGKDQSKGLRGHSSFYAALDFAIEVKVDKDVDGKVQRRTFSVVKQREGEGGLTREFEISGVELGRHPKRPDKRVSGPLCKVKPGEAIKANPKLSEPRGGNKKLVYTVLCSMVSKVSRHGESRNTARGWGVPTSALVDAVAAKLPKPKDGHDRRRETAVQALRTLSPEWVWFIEEGPVQYALPARFADK
jgi:KaiC/GvpD/RAD55 family RecA-like ATPase